MDFIDSQAGYDFCKIMEHNTDRIASALESIDQSLKIIAKRTGDDNNEEPIH